MSKQNMLMKLVQAFFQSHLPTERGLSTHTIKSYRDTIKLFLAHIASKNKITLKRLSLDDVTAKNVISFLNSIEKKRKNSVRTRNQRLAVLKTFFTYLLSHDITRANQYEKVMHISAKRAPYKPIEYLNEEEVNVLFKSIDRGTNNGLRDYALLVTMYNTGARAQEISDLKISDINLEKPYVVVLSGKGNKKRHVPIWENTAKAIVEYLKLRPGIKSEDYLFLGQRRASLSRFGIRYLVQARIRKAAKICKTLENKDIGPHTLRHTTAMHLLQSGVDITVIKSWLGHVDLNTTHGYIEIDMKMKEKALNKNKSGKKISPIKQMMSKEKDIVKWLEAL